MRITKGTAEYVCKILLSEKTKEIEFLSDSLNEYVYQICLKKIPNRVVEFFKDHKEYTNYANHINLCGPGIDYLRINFKKHLPVKSTTISIEEKEANEIVRQRNIIHDLINDERKLEREIINTLLALKTYKNIEEHFPEAFVHLPENNTSTGLIVDITELRSKIKS